MICQVKSIIYVPFSFCESQLQSRTKVVGKLEPGHISPIPPINVPERVLSEMHSPLSRTE